MSVSIQTLSGRDALPYVADLSALRVEVFREYPYLYVGTPENEARYLQGYAKTERSAIVIATDDTGGGSKVVGASTAMPLLEHGDNVAPALSAAGFDPQSVYYFGESVLRTDYRGQGIGHAFFDQREAQARKHGFPIAAFCAVQRPDNHPARPATYVPHDAFWQKRGYVRRADIVAKFSWRDVGDAEESEKPMVFWLKELQ